MRPPPPPHTHILPPYSHPAAGFGILALTDASLRAVARHCPLLEELYVCGSALITRQVLQGWGAHWPEHQTLHPFGLVGGFPASVHDPPPLRP